MKQALMAMVFAVALAACAKKQIVRQPAAVPPPVVQETDEASVRSGDWQSVPEAVSVYFSYDSAELDAAAREALGRNADYLKENAAMDILVEGHCDERGTTEYNLALGQRRAAAVRDYYRNLGIPMGRLATISYGEEKPVDPRSTENAWAKNRRAETKVKENRQLSSRD